MRRSLLLLAALALAAPVILLRPARARPCSAGLPQKPSASQGPAGAQAAERVLRTVVIDPAHGGADAGAHGPSGVLERDVVLSLAQAVASTLERRGLRVVLTRRGQENPTFDERAAIADVQPDAIFLSLHVASTGPAETVRVYYYDFSKLEPSEAAPAPPAMLPWMAAQRPSADLSRRLAELLQVELAEQFRGSPELPLGAAVYQLRLIAEPAVAVEISSVEAPNAGVLEAMAPQVAAAVAQGVASFRLAYEGSIE